MTPTTLKLNKIKLWKPLQQPLELAPSISMEATLEPHIVMETFMEAAVETDVVIAHANVVVAIAVEEVAIVVAVVDDNLFLNNSSNHWIAEYA